MVLSDGDGNLVPVRLAIFFYTGLQCALNKLVKSETRYGELHLFNQTLVVSDKISKLQLLWQGKHYRNLMISVDLVPCYRIERKNAKSLPLGMQCNDYFLICKHSRRNWLNPDSRFQMSHSRVEKGIVVKLPKKMPRKV